MISKNNIHLASTQSVFNTEIVNNGIESNPESNGINVDESINSGTGVGTRRLYGVEGSPCEVNSESTISTDKDESVFVSDITSIQLTDESIGAETSVGTGRKGGVESYQVNVDSEVTILIGGDESVLNKSKAVGGYSDDPLYPADTAWNPSKIRMGGGDPAGIMSINIWLDNREGRDWLGRVEREGIFLQSIHILLN
jgi:hypothetical protein